MGKASLICLLETEADLKRVPLEVAVPADRQSGVIPPGAVARVSGFVAHLRTGGARHGSRARLRRLFCDRPSLASLTLEDELARL